MQNTTLAEVIEELQQQYEAVGNIPVRILENELSLVLVYEQTPSNNVSYIVGTHFETPNGTRLFYVVDDIGSRMALGSVSDADKRARRFTKDEAMIISDKLNASIPHFIFNIVPVVKTYD